MSITGGILLRVTQKFSTFEPDPFSSAGGSDLDE